LAALAQALTVSIGTADAGSGAAMEEAANGMAGADMGCALTGVIAAFCAGQTALAAYGLAGEAAGRAHRARAASCRPSSTRSTP